VTPRIPVGPPHSAVALGYVDEPGYDFDDGASLVDPNGLLPAIGLLRVPEGMAAKNRMHIDIRVAGGTRSIRTCASSPAQPGLSRLKTSATSPRKASVASSPKIQT